MPVRLFSGARSSGISFNMLHRTDKSRLKQQYICQADGQVVERSDIVKGYEFRKDEYIIIEPDEIKKIEPQTAKTMEILEFVKESEVDPVYFESSYYMMPEEAGRRPYALLTKALEESEYVAIAKITMHNREYTVFLRPHEGGMMLHTMYYAEEVKKVEGFGAPEGVELKDAEVKVAHQLIEALAGEWDAEKYKDTFQENLKQLIETKLEGGEVAEVEKTEETGSCGRSHGRTQAEPGPDGRQKEACSHSGSRRIARGCGKIPPGTRIAHSAVSREYWLVNHYESVFVPSSVRSRTECRKRGIPRAPPRHLSAECCLPTIECVSCRIRLCSAYARQSLQ